LLEELVVDVVCDVCIVDEV